MRYVAAVFAFLFAIAATPSELAPDVIPDGFHVDPTVSATDECVEVAVADARRAGSELFVIVLAVEPDGGATAFSAGMLEEVGGPATVFVVAPRTVDYADSQAFWTAEELDSALAASKRVASDNDVVRTFVNTLTDGDALCSNSSTEGKSGWAYVAMLVIIGGGMLWFAGRSIARAVRKSDEAAAAVEEPSDT